MEQSNRPAPSFDTLMLPRWFPIVKMEALLLIKYN